MNSFELYTIREEDDDSSFDTDQSDQSEMQKEITFWQKVLTWMRRMILICSKPVFYVFYGCFIFAVITFMFKILANPTKMVGNDKNAINLTKINFSQATLCNDTTSVMDEYVDTDINMTGIVNHSIKTWMVFSNHSKYNTSRLTNCIPTFAVEHNGTEMGRTNNISNTISPQLDSVLIESNYSTLDSDAATAKLNSSLSILNETSFAVLLDIIFKHKVYPPLFEITSQNHVERLNRTNLDI